MFARVRGGDRFHARLQAALSTYIASHQDEWVVETFVSLSVNLRRGWFPTADVCVYPQRHLEGPYPTDPPILWIEILSPEDVPEGVLTRANELNASSVPYVWIIDPYTLESEVHVLGGVLVVRDHTLRLPDSPITIPLDEIVFES